MTINLFRGIKKMARSRVIKPEITSSVQFAECSMSARLLFVLMLPFCDDGGRHVVSFKRLKMEVFPADSFSIDNLKTWVEELENARDDAGIPLLDKYEVNGVEYWEVTGWSRHQKVDWPTYKYPDRNGIIPTSGRVSRRGLDEDSSRDSRGLDESSCKEERREEKRIEEERRGENVDSSAAENQPAEPTVLVFPTVGRGPKEWALTQAFLKELVGIYPNVNVLAECKKALSKIRRKAVPAKTAGGMPNFLYLWMDRTQNSSRVGGSDGSQPNIPHAPVEMPYPIIGAKQNEQRNS